MRLKKFIKNYKNWKNEVVFVNDEPYALLDIVMGGAFSGKDKIYEAVYKEDKLIRGKRLKATDSELYDIWINGLGGKYDSCIDYCYDGIIPDSQKVQ